MEGEEPSLRAARLPLSVSPQNEQLLMAFISSEKYEAMSSVESRELWKRCERCEEKVERWEFVE